MRACTRCAKPILPTAIVCPHCGAGVVESGPNAIGSGRGPVIEDGPTFPLVKVALGLFAVGLLLWFLLPTKFPEVDLIPAGSNPTGYDQCAGKQRCIMVYVAPWCPACKKSLTTIKGMVARCEGSSDVGVKPIVGNGRSQQTMQQMAVQIGNGVFLDPGGRVMSAAGERSVPHWFVLDADGNLVKKQAGVIPDVEIMFRELDLPDCSLGG